MDAVERKSEKRKMLVLAGAVDAGTPNLFCLCSDVNPSSILAGETLEWHQVRTTGGLRQRAVNSAALGSAVRQRIVTRAMAAVEALTAAND